MRPAKELGVADWVARCVADAADDVIEVLRNHRGSSQQSRLELRCVVPGHYLQSPIRCCSYRRGAGLRLREMRHFPESLPQPPSSVRISSSRPAWISLSGLRSYRHREINTI